VNPYFYILAQVLVEVIITKSATIATKLYKQLIKVIIFTKFHHKGYHGQSCK
jgi:hypothetical protein